MSAALGLRHEGRERWALGGWVRVWAVGPFQCWVRGRGGGGSNKGVRGTDVASICLCSESGRPMRLASHGAGFVGQLDQQKDRHD